MIAEPYGNVDVAAFCGSWAGLLFISLAFTAIGTFCSSLSKSQIVCFIVSVLACGMFYYGFDLLASLTGNATLVNSIEAFGGNRHFLSLARGVLDLRDITYFISIAVLFISTTILYLGHRHD